jgi:hypothetical protein
VPAKFIVAYPLTYHYLGGVRHFVWDLHKIGNKWADPAPGRGGGCAGRGRGQQLGARRRRRRRRRRRAPGGAASSLLVCRSQRSRHSLAPCPSPHPSADKTSLLEKDKVEESSKILLAASLAISSIFALV